MMGELSRLAQRALSVRPPNPKKSERGGLLYPFDARLAALAVSHQRTVTRVLWELYESRARRLESLYDDLSARVAADPRAWCWDGAGISVRARNVGDFAAGERQIVGTVKNALIDGGIARGIALELSPDQPDLLIDVRMHDRMLTVSLDLGGRSLSQRGYRESAGAAPLREHLAAALCMLSRHDSRRQLLLDPMCGSGTICIEAALMARAAPRTSRPLPELFRRLPVFAEVSPLNEPLFADTRPLVLGNDIDRRVLRLARENAQRAGVDADIVWHSGDVRDLTREQVESWVESQNFGGTTESGVIVCNPPYGHRMDERDLADLYRDLGRFCSQFRGWRAVFLIANDAWSSAFGRRPRSQKRVKNGNLLCDIAIYDL